MASLRIYVNKRLLLPREVTMRGNEGAVLEDAGDLVAVVSKVTGCQCPSREDVERERESLLQQELAAVDILSTEKSCASYANQSDMLKNIIISLRKQEKSRSFHSGLLVAVRQLGGGEKTGGKNSYSTTNFAFGTTPFDSWHRLCSSQTIRNAVQNWPRGSPRTDSNTERAQASAGSVASVTTPSVVFGSSSGSLVFFTSLLLGQPCCGVEILPFLHEAAQTLQKEYNTPAVSFVLADMLHAKLHGTRLIVLSSQCWDNGLYGKVMTKLENELATESIVVDYRGGLSSSSHFHLAEVIDEIRVSWNQVHRLFIYKKICPVSPKC